MIDGYARAFVVEDENKQGIIHYNVSCHEKCFSSVVAINFLYPTGRKI